MRLSFALLLFFGACRATGPQTLDEESVRLELGRHSVTCRARDASGNEMTCTFNVEVVLDRSPFIRGDINADRRFDIADGVSIVNFLFLGSRRPECLDTADTNDDGTVEITDPIYFLNYYFLGGPRPAEPFLPFCGFDLTPDPVGCESYRYCE